MWAVIKADLEKMRAPIKSIRSAQVKIEETEGILASVYQRTLGFHEDSKDATRYTIN
jgi:hypothetical protein